MDCTVVSLMPYAIEETKPGVIPGVFLIPAAKDRTPGILHIDDGHSNLYMGEGKTFPIKHGAEEIAKALINDYWTAQLESSEDARPALFWVYGKLSAVEVMAKHKKELQEAKTRQNKWFMNLVRKADDDWAVSKQHRMISDLQRNAAIALGLKNKEWVQGAEIQEFIKCVFCSTMVEASAAICHNCKNIVNPERARELGLKTPEAAKAG